MIPLVMTTFGKLRPAESHLQSLADVACSTGFDGRGVTHCEAISELCFGSGSWYCVSSLLQEHCEVCWERFS